MSLKKSIAAMILGLSFTAAASAQGNWSGWNVARGGDADIEYRWRVTTCLPVGCFKDVQFRNNSKQSILFNYTIWSEGMRDKGDEVKDTGLTSVSAEASSSITAGSGGTRVTRVSVERKK